MYFCRVLHLIIGGNSFCLLVLRRGEYIKTTTKALLTSLTCADLSMGLFCTFPRFLAAVFRSFLTPSTLTVICFATVITNGYFTTISTTSLLMVNFDRHFAIFFFCLPVVLTIVFYARILIIVRRLQSPDTNLRTSNESIGRHKSPQWPQSTYAFSTGDFCIIFNLATILCVYVLFILLWWTLLPFLHKVICAFSLSL